MKKRTIVEIIAFLFVTLFLYTAISKLMDVNIAKEQIALSPLLAPIAGAIVIVVPIAEILTAILLFLPLTRRYGLWAALTLMMAFTGYVIYILNSNDQLPCTCGGVLEQMSWTQHIIFNIGMTLLALTAIIFSRQPVERAMKEVHSVVNG